MPIPFLDSPYPIYKGKFWNIILYNDQSYLGRSIVYLKSREIEDTLLLTDEEHEELWKNILPRLEIALKKSFHPDRLNYAHFANTVHHVHWHIIPRYKENPIREFSGETFRDDCVGLNYAPYTEKKVSRDVMDKICAEIKKNF